MTVFNTGNNVYIKMIHQVYFLIKKQTTLIIMSTIMSFTIYTIANIGYWLHFYFETLIYIDIVSNCWCLWLIFAFNNNYYLSICKLCIKLNENCCVMNTTKLKHIGHLTVNGNIEALLDTPPTNDRILPFLSQNLNNDGRSSSSKAHANANPAQQKAIVHVLSNNLVD